ncbi:hypothetical protein OEA41_002889 [Lepraria neglecta]|uniref:C2H2-type domain-containing protein n=1 Tax=Lepraria neglecta TaxID=209136 RepID=A0AAD9Z3N0_9LECA|nr:hypothetical protein OEA41_002889 [Lepraria neglecta]
MAKLMRDNQSVTKKRNSVPIDPHSTNVTSSPQLPSLEWTPEAKAACAREAGRARSGESLADVDKDRDGRIKCPAKDCCDNTFPDADALLVHLGTYPCRFDGCPWLGRTQDDANRHFNYAHKAMAKPKTKVQCDECVEVFASGGSLKPHKERFHSTPTMAKCENCVSEVKEEEEEAKKEERKQKEGKEETSVKVKTNHPSTWTSESFGLSDDDDDDDDDDFWKPIPDPSLAAEGDKQMLTAAPTIKNKKRQITLFGEPLPDGPVNKRRH